MPCILRCRGCGRDVHLGVVAVRPLVAHLQDLATVHVHHDLMGTWLRDWSTATVVVEGLGSLFAFPVM